MVFSAGTVATGVRPETVAVMAEVGIDISGHRSKTLDEFRGQAFAWLITIYGPRPNGVLERPWRPQTG